MGDQQVSEFLQGYDPADGLTSEEFACLSMLTALLSRQNLAGDHQKVILDFLASAISNQVLNHTFNTACEKMKDRFSKNPHWTAANNCILDLTYRTRHLSELDFKTLSKIINKFIQVHTFSTDEKISIREYAIMHDLAAVAKVLSCIDKQLIEQQPVLMELMTNASLCDKVSKEIEYQIRLKHRFTTGLFDSYHISPNESALTYFVILAKILFINPQNDLNQPLKPRL